MTPLSTTRNSFFLKGTIRRSYDEKGKCVPISICNQWALSYNNHMSRIDIQVFNKMVLIYCCLKLHGLLLKIHLFSRPRHGTDGKIIVVSYYPRLQQWCSFTLFWGLKAVLWMQVTQIMNEFLALWIPHIAEFMCLLQAV